MIEQIICAVFGTLAFSLIFGVPRKYFLTCGIIGGISWGVNLAGIQYAKMSPVIAIFCATICVALLARIASVYNACPATVFIISGLIPLAPGTNLYWTVYYLVTDQLQNAQSSGIEAIKLVVAIVLGIALVFELPNKLFTVLFSRRKDRV